MTPDGADDRRDVRTAAWLGAALGIAFGDCFATGVWSHVAQNPPPWYPTRPAGLYRITQGVHVVTGTAAIPLLVAKLWVVHPHLFARPPVRSALHAVERLALLPLVGGAVFMLLSGTANVARWYPWGFFFPEAHYWVAWITIGAWSSTSARRRRPPGTRSPPSATAVPEPPGRDRACAVVRARSPGPPTAGPSWPASPWPPAPSPWPPPGARCRPCRACRCWPSAARGSGPRACP